MSRCSSASWMRLFDVRHPEEFNEFGEGCCDLSRPVAVGIGFHYRENSRSYTDFSRTTPAL